MGEYGREQRKQLNRDLDRNGIDNKQMNMMDNRKMYIDQYNLTELIVSQSQSNKLSTPAQCKSTLRRSSNDSIIQMFKAFPIYSKSIISKIEEILGCTNMQAKVVSKECTNYWNSKSGSELYKNHEFTDEEFSGFINEMVDFIDIDVTDAEGIQLAQRLNENSGEELIFLGYHGGRLDLSKESTAGMPNQLGDCLYIAANLNEAIHYAKGATIKRVYGGVAYVYKVFIVRSKLIEKLAGANKQQAIIKGVSVQDWWTQWPNVEMQYRQQYDIFISALFSDIEKKYTIQYGVHDTSILHYEIISTESALELQTEEK